MGRGRDGQEGRSVAFLARGRLNAMATTEERLRRLERSNRILICLIGLMMVGCGVALTSGSGPPSDTTDTRKVIVRDAANQPRIVLSVTDKDSTTMAFFDGK